MDDDRRAKNKLDVIFHRWIKGEGKKCTWDVLRECLKYANLITLAEKLESACSTSRDPTNPTPTNEVRSERTGTVTRSPSPSNIKPNKQATERQTGEQIELASMLRSSTPYFVLLAIIILLLTTAFFKFFSKTETGMWNT